MVFQHESNVIDYALLGWNTVIFLRCVQEWLKILFHNIWF